MKYEKIKKLTDNIIKNEYRHVQNEDFQNMDDLKKYKELASELSKIQKQLFQLLPIENHDLLNDFESMFIEICSIETMFYFKRGVSLGTSNLNFLRDITNGIIFY